MSSAVSLMAAVVVYLEWRTRFVHEWGKREQSEKGG